MSPLIRNIIAIAISTLAIAVGVTRYEAAPPQTLRAAAADVVWSHGRDGAAQNAQEHWKKHGREFPEFHNAEEYETGALAFVTMPPAETLIKTRENGDTLLYNPATNTFAVKDSSGEPRTFFRPDNGQAYWERQ